ncbi:protein of unknown function [Desulfovibrio sp. 86]|nr:protein of unknown function [Desulfovibrio sp. 86]
MEDGSHAVASSGCASRGERPRCSTKVASSAASPASNGEMAECSIFFFAVRLGESAGSPFSEAAEAAEEDTEDVEETDGLSPQSRNPISVCAAWRMNTGFLPLASGRWR